MRSHRSAGLTLAMMGLAGALLSGCPVYWGDDEDPCRAGRCAECDVNSDCATGEICSLGECIPDVSCSTTADCDAGQICAGDTCVPQDSCRTNGDCPTGAYCEDAVCVGSTECTGDAQCTTANFWCDFRSTCVPHGPTECRAAGDCVTGSQLCIENECVDVGETCTLDRECPGGQVCLNAECTVVCATTDDCAAGDVCIGSFCRPQEDCSTSDDCDAGSHCVSARCLPDCRGSDTCDDAAASCEADGFCRPTWEPEPFCTMDSDCASGRVCREGVCRTPCATMMDSECMAIDSQLPLCRASAGGDFLCFSMSDLVTPECDPSRPCSGDRDCVNGQCRAR